MLWEIPLLCVRVCVCVCVCLCGVPASKQCGFLESLIKAAGLENTKSELSVSEDFDQLVRPTGSQSARGLELRVGP